MVTTAIALMLLARNIYGDRIEGGGNRSVRNLDQRGEGMQFANVSDLIGDGKKTTVS